MGLPSQRSDDDSALVDEITRSIDGADDPKKVRSLLNAWWRYAGVRAAAGAGMMTIMVPDLLDPTEEMRSLCIRIAADLHEVRELLEGRRGG